MYQRILVATDGSNLSRKAVSSAIALAGLAGAELVVLKVVARYPMTYFEGGMAVQAGEVARIEKQWADAAQAIVDGVKKTAMAKGVKAKGVTVKSDLVSEAIIATAKKHKCDLIVIPPPCPLSVSPLDFGHGEELMADGDKREVAKVKVTSVTRIERTASAD